MGHEIISIRTNINESVNESKGKIELITSGIHALNEYQRIIDWTNLAETLNV